MFSFALSSVWSGWILQAAGRGTVAAPEVFPSIQVNTNDFFNTRQKSYDFGKIIMIFVK
jgi:hypothetical protein